MWGEPGKQHPQLEAAVHIQGICRNMGMQARAHGLEDVNIMGYVQGGLPRSKVAPVLLHFLVGLA